MKYSPALLLTSVLVCATASGADFITGQGARLIIGQATFTDALPLTTQRNLGAAGGVAYANNTLFIADSSRFSGTTPQNRRVLIYTSIGSKLPRPTDSIPVDISRCPVCTGRNDFPYTADSVLGQTDFQKADVAISRTGMRLPTAVASDGRIVVVADTENNRVLIWNSIPTNPGAPADIVLGQEGFDRIQQPPTVTANSFRGPQGVWIQNGRLYVADTQNHRVLVWRSIPTQNNQPADIVLGQADFTTAPEPDLTKLSTAARANNMLNPVSVTSDGRRLFVTDLGFNRVLIWNTIPDSNTAPADVVIGEPDMDSTVEGGNDVTKVCQPTGKDAQDRDLYPARCGATLSFPRYALSDGTRLFIADGGNDRVLIFNQVPTSNGAIADVVLGQSNMTENRITDYEDIFTPNLQRSSADTIRTPTSLAWDGTNLYVADPFDRRVLVFTPAEARVPVNGVRNAASLEVYAVGSIEFVAPPKENDEVTIKIADKEYKYKARQNDTIGHVISNLVLIINEGEGDPNVLALANPAFNAITLTSKLPGESGNAIEITHSVTPATGGLALTVTNPAGGRDAAKIAPGALVTIVGENLSDVTMAAAPNAEVLPRELGNVQVYFDGIRAPLLFVSPTQINAQMPYEMLDTTSVTSWVRTVRQNGDVSVTTAVAVPITLQNPGIFAEGGSDPRPAIAFHASSGATVSILIDGGIKAGDVATIKIEDREYKYTVVEGDTLAKVRDAFISQINENPEERVTAQAGGSFTRVILTAKEPGEAGNEITVEGSAVDGASISISPARERLCCGNIAGALVTPDNPAIPGQMIYIYATGLGIVLPEEGLKGLRTGEPYVGPAINDPNAFVSALAGGRTANVISAGAEPGTIGLYRVLLELNPDLPTNPQTQVTIAQDIYVSNIVTIVVVNPNPPEEE
jgi:uncharacterized protein (TIGR03437 family)